MHHGQGEDFDAHHGEEGEGSLLFLNIYLYSSPSSFADNTRDILNDHRGRNRPNKPPSEQRLLDAARHQLQGDGNARDMDSHTDNNEVEDEDEDENEDEADMRQKRGRRHKPAEANPKTAGHYPECWREAIDRAKEQFRRFVMLYHLFPSRDALLQDATRILSKVIADERSDGKLFNPSKLPLVSITCISNFSC